MPGTYLTVARGSSLSTAQCEYIDEAHFKWGDKYYHTEQFANMLKNCKTVCYPEHVHIESELAISCGALYFYALQETGHVCRRCVQHEVSKTGGISVFLVIILHLMKHYTLC